MTIFNEQKEWIIRQMLKVFAIGNVTGDPELRRSGTSGKLRCVMRLACDRRYRSRDGEKITDFISVKAPDNLAELCAERVKKGDKIAVFGDFETVVVEDSPERQPGFLIKASAVEFLTPRKTMSGAVAALCGGFAVEDAA
jgi:single-strand DNA-binding protein